MTQFDAIETFRNYPITPGERAFPAMQRLINHIEAKLKELREKNDDPDLTPERTTWLRGQIATLKSLHKVLTDERPLM